MTLDRHIQQPAVFPHVSCRFVEEGNSCHLECTATILPGRAGAGLKNNSASALLDVKPK